MNMDALGDSFASLSEGIQRAARGWHAVYDNLPEEKVDLVRRVETLIRLANEAWFEIAHGGTSAHIVSYAGSKAYNFCESWDELARLQGMEPDDPALIDKVQKVNDWMDAKGWVSIATVSDSAGRTVHHKTAAGMLADMRRYRSVYMDYLKGFKPEEVKRSVGI